MTDKLKIESSVTLQVLVVLSAVVIVEYMLIILRHREFYVGWPKNNTVAIHKSLVTIETVLDTTRTFWCHPHNVFTAISFAGSVTMWWFFHDATHKLQGLLYLHNYLVAKQLCGSRRIVSRSQA